MVVKVSVHLSLEECHLTGGGPLLDVEAADFSGRLFVGSDCELVDFECYNDLTEEEIKNELQKVLPEHCIVKEAKRIDKHANSIDTTVCWAEYEIKLFNNSVCDFKTFMYNCDRVLSSPEI